jgi:hypothetical protein
MINCFSPFIILIMSGSEAHILAGNTTPNKSRSNWDLSSGILAYLLDRPFRPINMSIRVDDKNVDIGI